MKVILLITLTICKKYSKTIKIETEVLRVYPGIKTFDFLNQISKKDLIILENAFESHAGDFTLKISCSKHIKNNLTIIDYPNYCNNEFNIPNYEHF